MNILKKIEYRLSMTMEYKGFFRGLDILIEVEPGTSPSIVIRLVKTNRDYSCSQRETKVIKKPGESSYNDIAAAARDLVEPEAAEFAAEVDSTLEAVDSAKSVVELLKNTKLHLRGVASSFK